MRSHSLSAAALCVACCAAFASQIVAADEDRYATKIESTLIGDYTTYSGLAPVVLEGVGLVVDLPGTGGDPAPSLYRTLLLEEMKRFNVPQPNKVLASPSTALVIVRAYLPPLIRKGDKLDVEVYAPDSANVKSLAGGWLMETYLTEQMFVPGRGLMKGHEHARAKGPVLAAGVTAEDKGTSEMLQRGRVLAGATVTRERELAIYLRNDFRSVRNSDRIAKVIGMRFHDYDKYGIKKPMAVAKTDQKLTLDLQPKYKNNYPRYLQVIRHMAFKEDVVAQRVRMQQLQEELFEPEKCEKAALQFEAIGASAVPALKAALKSPFLECRYQSAMALAYLGEAEAVPHLVEAAKQERAFRVFALAALSTVDDADAHLALRELMSERSEELRYGAFRSLWTLDRNDPFIRGEPMLEPVDPAEATDPMNEKPRQVHFMLHVLETTGEPMVHATLRTRPEIVLFGADQQFSAPLMLSAGRHIMITAQAGSETASLVRFTPDEPDQRRTSSLKVADVIRAAVELGARYPDIVQMLAEASRQRNLPTRLATDALPSAGRKFVRAAKEGEEGREARSGREDQAPNLFFPADDPETKGEGALDGEDVQASVPAEEAAPKADGKGDEKGSRKRWPWNRGEKDKR